MTLAPHVIGRQVLELEVESERDAFALQQELGELFRAIVVPAMGALFDRCVPADVVLRLERLEIDLGRLPRDRLDETLAARVCEALEAKLALHLRDIRTEDVERVGESLSRDDHVLVLWHYVLLHGHLPWWATPASAGTLGSRVLEALESRDALPPPTARLLREHRVAIQRIALQGDQALLERLFRLAAADVSAVSKPVFESLLRLIGVRPFEALRPEMVRRHLWQAALEESVHATAADPQTRLRSLLRAALEASARSASMSYRELLSQLHERLQAAASRTARAIPADIREPLLTALPREGVAEGKTPSDDLRFTREGPSAQTVGDRDEVASSHEGNEKGDASPTRRKRERAATSPPDHPGESAMPTERDILVEAKTRREAVVSEGDVIFVDDAGIALLHPFLAAHFEKLGLQRDGAFLDDDTRERAVHQVRFLATGEEQSPEPLLVFAKIMCGLTPGVPIARSAPLGEYAKTEANALLQAVIRHWGALKNATPDGLRETFLRREGRLERKDDGWKLRVESRSYDLLLDRLPWSLSVVRLPWMADVLFVEWG